MTFLKVLDAEADIKASGFNGAFKIALPALVPVKNEPDLLLTVFRATPAAGYKSYYFEQSVPKTQILLHFTTGHLRGDLSTLTTADHQVSVPFVVARDGTVYSLFKSDYWSYHVGKGNVANDNTTLSKKTIGIELSNYGPLKPDGNDLRTDYGDIYCTLDDTDQYVKLVEKYRDSAYYATFTDAQYEATIVLLRYLTAQYDIPRAFLPENIRYKATTDAVPFRGIISHVNYRADKCDIGPAFDWQRVIDGTQADSFTPQYDSNSVGTRDLDALPINIVASERDLEPPVKRGRKKKPKAVLTEEPTI